MADLTLSTPVDTMLAAADNTAIRAAMGLGTLATQSGTFSGTSSGTNTGDQTNVTGSAGTVTSIGNLTGVVTSVNRVTSIADAALSIAKTSGLQTALDAKAAKAIVTKSTASNYTVGTTDANELYGGVIYVTAAATITVPAVAAGASFTVVTIGAVAVSIDPNAADLIYLDGVALSDGDKITNLSHAGDIATLTYLDGTGWYASTNGWTDGN